MAEDRLQRRLAAILSADVVGLSRLNALRRELIDPAIAAHSGRCISRISRAASYSFNL